MRRAAGRLMIAAALLSCPAWAEEPRDPFQFGSAEQQLNISQQPTLTGIVWDARSPLAIFDGEPVAVGQELGGWRVIQILEDRVIVEQGARQELVAPGEKIPAE